MKKIKKLIGFASLSLFGVALLAGCEPTYSEEDIVSIEINEATFNGSWTFYLDTTVSYNTLAVDLLDSNSNVLNTIKYTDSPSSFEYSTIDTSELVTGGIFSVTYTTSLGTSFSATHEYNVVETTNATPTSWAQNDQYSYYLSSVSTALDQNTSYYDVNGNFDLSLITDTDLASTSLMRSDGKFYVANHNAVDLSPVRYAFVSSGDLVITSAMPDNTTISIYAQSDTSMETNLVEDYFDDDDYEIACTTGMVDFTDDLSGLETDIRVVFSVDGNNPNFSTLTMDVTLVDGWNITEAEQLILIDNAKTSSSSYSTRVQNSYLDKKKEVLGTNDVTATTSYEAFVLFNDVTIELEDLPDGVLWQSGDTGYAQALDGTLKDWYFIYEHNIGQSWGNTDSNEFNFYGNYNSIILGETFPYVISERSDYTNSNTGLNPDKVDTHTTLFGSNQSSYTEEYSFYFYDLTAVGNQGVSTDQQIDIDDDGETETAGGVLFCKNRADTNFENCNINSFFTIFVTQGEGNASSISNEYQIDYNLNYTKMNNCYSTPVFVYGESNVNVNNSLLSNSGGPLFILQSIAYGGRTFDEEQVEGTNVVVDENTVLKNYVTGQGGWFDLMGATNSVSTLKNIGYTFERQLNKSFVTNRSDGEEVLNLIAIALSTNMEEAGALDPDMRSTFKVGGVEYINYTSGEDELDDLMEEAAESGMNTTLLGQIADAIANTTYGSQFLFYALSGVRDTYSNAYTLPSFMTYDENGNQTFTTVTSSDGQNFDSIVSTGYYINLLGSELGLGNLVDAEISSDFADGSDYITAYFAMSDGDFSAPSISTSNSNSFFTSLVNAYLNSYQGSTAYGVVFELFDA